MKFQQSDTLSLHLDPEVNWTIAYFSYGLLHVFVIVVMMP